MVTQEHVTRLELFRSLMKDGCTWHGDLMSIIWAEELFFEEEFIGQRVRETLAAYPENSYRLFDSRVLIR